MRNPINSDLSILYLGCGAGFLFFFHDEIKHCKRLIGLDISFKSLQIAKKVVQNIVKRDFFEFICCDSKYLPFKEKTIEYGITVDSLHHIKNPLFALSELNKVVSLIICIEPNSLNPIRKRYEKRFNKRNQIRERSFTFSQMKELFTKNKMKSLNIQGLHFFPYFRKNNRFIGGLLKVAMHIEKYLARIFLINQFAGCVVIVGKS